MNFKYTVFGQMLELAKTHLFTAVIFSFVWLMLIMVWDTAVGGVAFTVIALGSYLLSLYSCGEKNAKDDKKTFVRGCYNLKKCLYIPSLLVALNLIFMVMYKLTWVYAAADGALEDIWGLFTSAIAYGWFAPFGYLIHMEKGIIELAGAICVIVIPYLMYFLGYYAVTKDYDITVKLFGFMYEKKKK